MVMLAPGTTAPEESFTTPRIVPVFCCAVAVTATVSKRVAAAAISPVNAPERFTVLLSINPPFVFQPSAARTPNLVGRLDAGTNGIRFQTFAGRGICPRRVQQNWQQSETQRPD